MMETRFETLAVLADALAAEGGRLKKRAAIVEVLVTVALGEGRGGPTHRPSAADEWGTQSGGKGDMRDAGLFCLYLAGQPFAEADPRKLNAGGALLTRAVKAVSGCTDAALTAAYRQHGDLGGAAAEVWEKQGIGSREQGIGGLLLGEVESAFAGMASARTTVARAALVEGLLRRASAVEAKYLVKLMLGDMRIGVKQSLIEEAIGVASGTAVAAVRHAVMLEADLGRAVRRAFAGTLAEARMTLFHPLGFMLASPVETPEEAVERFTARPVKLVVPKVLKKRRRGSAEPDDLVAEDAAEEGLAEDVALEAGMQGAADGTAEIHAFLEDKYDGMRAQVHCGDPAQPGRVAIYSRNREEITESFPEIVEAFAGVTEPLMLDGELLGWDFASGDRQEGKALPFSVLGQRIGRKRVDAAMRRAIPAVFMVFDLLFEAGELLLPLPLRERRARLEAVVERLSPVTVSPLERPAELKAQRGLFDLIEEDAPSAAKAGCVVGAGMDGLKPVPFKTESPSPSSTPMPRLMLSPARMVESAEAIDQAYADARARANEGVMLKAAGSAYLPGRRGLAWVKLKRELATLDVVITGAEFGHGRRAGLLSDYTFAVRGPRGANGEPAELLNVGKAYSGVTDAEILELTAWLQAHTLEDHGHFRTVEPIRVLEVAFNNVMRSDRHASGFALRFPRILRIRDDKPVEEIDTLERVEAVFQSQPDKG